MSQAAKKPDPSGISREELIGRARDLVPKLRERAGATEEARRLLDETERDFHDTGLFRMVQPARVGGSELDFGILIDVPAEIGRGCASSSWNLTNLGSHHWMLGMFAPAAQDAVWDRSADALVASSFIFPAGRAKRTEGGYVLSGRWPFCSGVDNSDWNMLAGMVAGEDPDEPPEHRMFLVHKSEYEIIDTWHATALRGTGSKDVSTDEVFVPEHMTLAVDDTKGGPTPGSEVNPGPLFRFPTFAAFPYCLSGVALGTALGAWDDYVGATRKRASSYTGDRLSGLQTLQIKIAEAGAMTDAAALVMRHNCAEMMEDATANRVPDIETKVKYRRDAAYTAGLCTQAVDLLFGASGGGGLYERNAMQRHFRDIHGINAHVGFNMDVAGAGYGRVMLGHEPDNPTL